MADEESPRGNFFLDTAQTERLWNHVRALETIDEATQELRDDRKARKEIAKADGFDTNILDVIVKRRKTGAGMTREADNLLKIYEEAMQELGVKPLEDTRKAREAGERRTIDQIAEDLHGEKLPGPERTLN